MMQKARNTYRSFVRKLLGKPSLGKPRPSYNITLRFTLGRLFMRIRSECIRIVDLGDFCGVDDRWLSVSALMRYIRYIYIYILHAFFTAGEVIPLKVL